LRSSRSVCRARGWSSGPPREARSRSAHAIRIRDLAERRTEEYEIVGSGEGDPSAGRVSSESPVGSALLEHRAGESIEVETPAGRRRLKIVEVR
jgi:transcription elongation factor GreA